MRNITLALQKGAIAPQLHAQVQAAPSLNLCETELAIISYEAAFGGSSQLFVCDIDAGGWLEPDVDDPLVGRSPNFGSRALGKQLEPINCFCWKICDVVQAAYPLPIDQKNDIILRAAFS